jgi:hypothetical protein
MFVFQVMVAVVSVVVAATALITGNEVVAVVVAVVLEATMVVNVISLDVAMVPEALLDTSWK